MTYTSPCNRALSVLLLVFFILSPLSAAELSQTIANIKPSIVGIGTYQKTRSPAVRVMGTGFAVADGLSIITNAHVSQILTNDEKNETLGIIIGQGEALEFRPAVVVGLDVEHDLTRLKIGGAPLPAMTLGDSEKILEGKSLAFTGFPIGAVLGLYPVTHRGMVSSITPIVRPAPDSKRLDVKMLAQILKSPYLVFQLDATAYPGSSGSPLYDPETGVVYGVINSVLVKGLKESAITNPSGITYAIPAKYVRELMQRN